MKLLEKLSRSTRRMSTPPASPQATIAVPSAATATLGRPLPVPAWWFASWSSVPGNTVKLWSVSPRRATWMSPPPPPGVVT